MSDEQNVIEITDDWRIRPDSKCYILEEVYEIETDEGGTKEGTNRTYHRTLLQCLKEIRREEAKDCEIVEELIDYYKKAFEMDKELVQDAVQERWHGKEVEGAEAT